MFDLDKDPYLHSDDYFKGEDFSKVEPIELKGKKILAFKGGGGKGNAYLGVIWELESERLKELLPLRPNISQQIIGVSGASAGAITALVVSLGLNSKDIEKISKRATSKFLVPEKGFEFADFMLEDELIPGSYRAVEINQIEGAISTKIGFSCDTIYQDDLPDSQAKIKYLRKLQNRDTVKNEQDLEVGSVNQFLRDSEKSSYDDIQFKRKAFAKSIGIKILPASGEFETKSTRSQALGKLNNETRDNFAYKSLISALDVYLFLKKDSHNPIIQALLNPEKKHKILYNILYDRGLFAGTYIRFFFKRLIDHYLCEFHDIKYDPIRKKLLDEELGALTFQQFYDVTGVDLRIGGTNLTAGENVIFSYKHTPFFPVCEAVGLSMNIPGVFKPVYIKNKNLNGTEIEHKTTNLKSGFYVDSGLTNNMPMRTFIETGDANDSEIFGFRVIEGPNPELFNLSKPYIYDDFKNYRYSQRKLYGEYLRKYALTEGTLPVRKHPISYADIPPEKRSLFGTSLFNYLSVILEAVLNTATNKDINGKISPNLMNVYSYDISTLDFTPQPELLSFCAEEARVRSEKILKFSD